MEYSFPHYLLAKQSVDDRALNKDVLAALRSNLPDKPIDIIEVGAGIGTMLARLIRWDILLQASYVLVDEMEENIAYARTWIPQWAATVNLTVEQIEPNKLLLTDSTRRVVVRFEHADVFDFIQGNEKPADLLIAHAFLDLLPMPESLPRLFSLTKSLAWLTINFDGATSLEPVIDAALDKEIEGLYHETMDARPNGGDSRAGRHLFAHLLQANARILSAGASDWVVHALNGSYPADEKYFLHFILHFFEQSLKDHTALDTTAFSDWLAARRAQVETGQLVYIAHQMDFLASVSKE